MCFIAIQFDYGGKNKLFLDKFQQKQQPIALRFIYHLEKQNSNKFCNILITNHIPPPLRDNL